MTTSTHLSFGALIYILFSGFISECVELKIIYILISSISSMLPDLDLSSSAIGRVCPFISRRLESAIGHRTLTHSILGIILLCILISPILLFSKQVYAAIIIGYWSHIAIDCLNKHGVCLFYPSTIEAVFPGKKEYRIKTSGKAERILFFVIIVLILILYPISRKGFKKSLHWVLGNVQSAVTDYRDYSLNYETFANIKAVNNFNNALVKGEFKIIGAKGKNILILQFGNKLMTIGDYEDNNLRPEKVRVKKGESVTYVMQNVDMSLKILGDLKGYMDSTVNQRIYGTLTTIDDVQINESKEYYNTVTKENSKIILQHATWQDIVDNKLEYVYVQQGEIIIKSELRKGQAIGEHRMKFSDKKFTGKYDLVFTVGEREEVLVSNGQKVARNQVVAEIDRNKKEFEMKSKEVEEIRDEIDNCKSTIWTKNYHLARCYSRIETLKTQGKKEVKERAKRIKIKEKQLEILYSQKELAEKKWDKIQIEKIEVEIYSTEMDLQELKEQGESYPISIQLELDTSTQEASFLENDLKMFGANMDKVSSRLKSKLAKAILAKQRVEQKMYIRSPVEGIIAKVEFGTNVEALTRVRIEVLETKNK